MLAVDRKNEHPSNLTLPNSPGFESKSGLDPQATAPRPDKIFEKWGLLRGPYSPRDYSSAPDFADPRLAQLFARKFMGAGCRAEVCTLLIHGLEVTTTELAQMTLYSQRLVQEVLRDMNEGGSLDWNPGRGRTTRPSLRHAVRDGFQFAMTNGRSSGGWYGHYEQRDWPGFFLGLHAIWRISLRISQSGFDGFKAESLLRDGLDEAFEYHGRTEIQAVYEPRSTTSFEDLLEESELYLDALFPIDSSNERRTLV